MIVTVLTLRRYIIHFLAMRKALPSTAQSVTYHSPLDCPIFLGHWHAVQMQITLANNHNPCLAPLVVCSLT